jgi:hypothetical protein
VLPRPVSLLAVIVLPAISWIACVTTSSTEAEVRRIDVDGDGRADLFRAIGPDGAMRETRAPDPSSDPPRTVVIAIDAIPYDLFTRLQREGLFTAFFPASRMLAPFPSLTDVSFTTILRTEPSAAYEDRYFDRGANQMGGGLGERISGEYKGLAPFHEVFDWEPPRFWGGFVYLEPERVAIAELQQVEEILADSDETELVLYLGATDGLGHEEGWEALEAHLRRIDAVLERWLAAGGASRRVVLLSDHGMSRGPTRRFDLEGALEGAGFRLGDRLDGERDVVAPAYGLIGSIQLYTACGIEAEVASAIASVDGADFTAWRAGEGFAAADARGLTDLSDRPAEDYPELRRRVADGVRNHTIHPASVFVSLADGWHYGLGLFEAFVSMEGTHGSARYDSSVGFLASNVDRTPAWIHAEDVYPHLGLERDPAPPHPFQDPCADGLANPETSD